MEAATVFNFINTFVIKTINVLFYHYFKPINLGVVKNFNLN